MCFLAAIDLLFNLLLLIMLPASGVQMEIMPLSPPVISRSRFASYRLSRTICLLPTKLVRGLSVSLAGAVTERRTSLYKRVMDGSTIHMWDQNSPAIEIGAS